MKKRIKKILFIIVFLIIGLYIFYKMQPTSFYSIPSLFFPYDSNGFDVFVVQNAPSSKLETVRLIQEKNYKMNTTNRIKNDSNYGQFFYIETFRLNRFYEPSVDKYGNEDDIRNNDYLYKNERLVVCEFKNIKDEANCKKDCPIYPYYIFYKDGKPECEYYPKGLKNNLNKHWSFK